MPDFTLSCPDCGGTIAHSCGKSPPLALAQPGANADAKQAQTSLTDANLAIAHVFDSKAVEASTKKSQRYNQGYDQAFLDFWEVYPLKRDKRKAQKAWRKSVERLARSSDANLPEAMEVIVTAAMKYRRDPNRLDQFTKYAEGWLNGDGWEDEPLPPRSNGKVDEATALARTALRLHG